MRGDRSDDDHRACHCLARHDRGCAPTATRVCTCENRGLPTHSIYLQELGRGVRISRSIHPLSLATGSIAVPGRVKHLDPASPRLSALSDSIKPLPVCKKEVGS
jgi:hypothetical protein